MKYRKLGDSDLEVSEISLGSWLTYGVGVEADKARACLEEAFKGRPRDRLPHCDKALSYSGPAEVTGHNDRLPCSPAAHLPAVPRVRTPAHA